MLLIFYAFQILNDKSKTVLVCSLFQVGAWWHSSSFPAEANTTDVQLQDMWQQPASLIWGRTFHIELRDRQSSQRNCGLQTVNTLIRLRCVTSGSVWSDKEAIKHLTEEKSPTLTACIQHQVNLSITASKRAYYHHHVVVILTIQPIITDQIFLKTFLLDFCELWKSHVLSSHCSLTKTRTWQFKASCRTTQSYFCMTHWLHEYPGLLLTSKKDPWAPNRLLAVCQTVAFGCGGVVSELGLWTPVEDDLSWQA